MNFILSLVITLGLSFTETPSAQTTDQETNQISTADGPRHIVTDGD